MCETTEQFPTRYGLRDVTGVGHAPRPDAYTAEYEDLLVISFTEDQNARSCNYWYAVQHRCRAHTAFHSRDHLMTWLEDRGLALKGDLAMAPEHSVVGIEGRYRVTSHNSYDAFFSLEGRRIRHLDNGDYTLGVITKDEDGVANIHHLNCNLRDRPVFDYQASRKAVG